MRTYYIIISLFLTVTLASQGGFRSVHQVPGSLIGQSKAIFELPGGDFWSAGIIVDTSNGIQFNRFIILGLNSSGNVLWTKKHGTSKLEYLDNDFISRSFIKVGNNFFYTGCVLDSSGKYSGVLIKFDINGNILWQKIYHDSSQDLIPQMVTKSVDGGFLITGFFQDWVSHLQPALLIKTDGNGNELWRRVLNKAIPNTQDGKTLLQDSASKKIIIVGYQYVGTQSSWYQYDNILILDSLGNNPVQKKYNYSDLKDILQTSDKKLIGVGITEWYDASRNSYYYYSYMVKFDPLNPTLPIWKVAAYDDYSYMNQFSCITKLTNGDILVAGSIDSIKPSDTTKNVSLRYVKINPSNGNIIWRRDYNYRLYQGAGENIQTITSLEATGDGGWVSAVRVLNQFYKPLFFVKYDSTGCDTVEHWCRSVALGFSDNLKMNVNEFNLYPNPARGSFTIAISQNSENLVHIKITDISGKLIGEFDKSPQEECKINSSGFASGMYFVTVSSKNRLAGTKKLMVSN